MPFEIYLDCEKRPQVGVDADRPEKKDGFYNFYKGQELVATFKEEKVIGYVKLTAQV